MELSHRRLFLRRAVLVSATSVIWNLLSGTTATVTGLAVGSVSLGGFGLDAAVDGVASIVLIWRFRVEHGDQSRAAAVEQRAGRAVGVALLVIAVYVSITAAVSLVGGAAPEHSLVGMGIALASLVILPPLAVAKRRLARRLGSAALRGDGVLTGVGAMLAAATLIGLLLSQLRGWHWADPVAGLTIAVILVREGLTLLRSASPAQSQATS
ncbi:MAG: cation transporter [Candidatus Dormibacteria bacterium]